MKLAELLRVRKKSTVTVNIISYLIHVPMPCRKERVERKEVDIEDNCSLSTTQEENKRKTKGRDGTLSAQAVCI